MKDTDTVMNDEELWAVDKLVPDCLPEEKGDVWWIERHYLKAQAEISFKAGIKEVVEWIRKYSRNWEGLSFNEQLEGRVPTRMRTFELMEQVWQAQLKKWGVKENNDTFGDT